MTYNLPRLIKILAYTQTPWVGTHLLVGFEKDDVVSNTLVKVEQGAKKSTIWAVFSGTWDVLHTSR